MKLRFLILALCFFSIGSLFGQKQYPFRTVDNDSVGYSDESALAPDWLIWKVGGNTVSANSVFGTNAAYDLIFRTNSTERMRILSGGSVGIGTTGNSLIRLAVSAADNTSSGYSLTAENSDGNAGLAVRNDSRVGINTYNPRGALEVRGNMYLTTMLTGSSSDSIVTTLSGLINKRSIEDVVGWKYNGAGTNIYNANSGGITIGSTSAPLSGYKLDIHGGAITRSTTPNSATVYGYNTATSGQNYGVFGQLTETNASGWGIGVYGSATGVTSKNVGVIGVATNATSNIQLLLGTSAVPTGNFAIYSASAHLSRLAGELQLTVLNSGAITDSTVTVDATGVLKKRTVASLVATYLSANGIITPTIRLTTGATNGYIATSDASGNLSWTNPTSITTATPTLAAVVAVNNNANNPINFPYGSGIGAGIATETYSRWGQNRHRFGLNVGSAADQYSNGNATTSLSGYGGVNLVTTDSTRLRINDAGFVGINTINPSALLDVNGLAKTSTLQVTTLNTAASGDAFVMHATGLMKSLSRQSVMLTGGNIPAGEITFGTANNQDVTLIRNNAYRLNLLANTASFLNNEYMEILTNTANKPSLRFSSNGVTGDWHTANSIATSVSVANNGDILYSPNASTLSLKVNDKRKDIAFGVNTKQLFNSSFTDGSDSSFVTISDTTRTLRVTNSGVTSHARINMPQNPQNDVKITVLIQSAPTDLNFKIVSGVTGQSFVTTTIFTPAAGDVYEIWFDSDTEGAVGGKWYIKKL